MAIEANKATESRAAHSGRTVRWATGANVGVAVALAVALVAALQWGAYTFDARADLTSTGVNTLSDGTEKLLESLNTEVRLTSLYFKTDMEAEDQAKYRSAAADLLNLYRGTNPGKVRVEHINPLQDHKKLEEMWKRLQEIPRFQEAAKPYADAIGEFQTQIAPEASKLLSEELQRLGGETGALTGGKDDAIVGAMRNFFKDHQQTLTKTQELVEMAARREVPDYAGALALIRTCYSKLGGIVTDLDESENPQVRSLTAQSPILAELLPAVLERFRPISQKLRDALPAASEMPELEFQRIRAKYTETGNCILVEAVGKDARLITFGETWPLREGGMGLNSDSFANHEFRGEEKISSAILQMVEEKKPAVVFVRHGGPPLFIPLGPFGTQAQYLQMRNHLTDLNFTVHEWNLAETTTPPEIDPPPSTTLYVVLKPMPSEQTRGQPPRTPPFGDEQRRAVIEALGENGRAMFLAGWSPSGMGPMPMAGAYEYRDYLQGTWGIDVQADTLVIQAEPIGPNEFRIRNGCEFLSSVTPTGHEIAKGLSARRSVFPGAAPLSLAKEPPQGVSLEPLLISKPRDGLWGVKDIQAYERQQQENRHVRPGPDALTGPFTLAAAATKQDARIVVVSSLFFALDDIAFRRVLVDIGDRYVEVNAWPGNVALFVNALHWLAGNTQWMNLGRPIDMRVIDIAEGPSLTFVKVLSYGIWPALALLSGGIVWMIRRR
ncbi:MAG: Gldg family protein [Phycisphaerae bacterium]|nr:Gldg family protein [Phycisphaerae bacterium]